MTEETGEEEEEVVVVFGFGLWSGLLGWGWVGDDKSGGGQPVRRVRRRRGALWGSPTGLPGWLARAVAPARAGWRGLWTRGAQGLFRLRRGVSNCRRMWWIDRGDRW